MAVTTWTAGEVLTAADLNDTFASKVDYALPVNAQTGTTYTFVAADAEKLTTASNAAAVTLTIPPQSSVTWSDNTVLRVVNYGAGAVTIDGGSGVTVTNTSSTIAQYGAAVAIRTGSDAWTVVPFGGGDVPAAEVSSPAATGQYTDTGITYDYYTFTASGTLTVDTAGFADVLVVGGGGGGGAGQASNEAGGGGGAGGHLLQSNLYLNAGTQTVVVGAGGSGGVVAGGAGFGGGNGAPSRLGPYYGVGGGGGGGYAGSTPGGPGGSGGGASRTATSSGTGISGQGSNGGAAKGGGGGGASAVGGDGTGGAGGAGTSSDLDGSSTARSGGGGGGNPSGTGGAGGTGGGGAGGSINGAGTAGTVNTGGGGGGGAAATVSNVGAAGGSGIVIIRVKV